jgi:hypothetical protein
MQHASEHAILVSGLGNADGSGRQDGEEAEMKEEDNRGRRGGRVEGSEA